MSCCGAPNRPCRSRPRPGSPKPPRKAIRNTMTDLIIRPQSGVITLAMAAWLDSKGGRSNSVETRKKYASTLTSFRAGARAVGLDLDGDPDALGLVAQAW